jgi:uridine kinase
MTRLIIGVAGGSGSGKTTTVERLVDRLGADNAQVLAHDRYYRDQSALTAEARVALNFDHPDALDTELLVEHVRLLRAGHAIQAPVYDFARHTRHTILDRIDPRPVIFLEGVLVLADVRLREVMDLRVFVETDDDTRYARRLRRDVIERGRTTESVQTQYATSVLPMHREFVEPSRRYADVIVMEGGFNDEGIARVMEEIQLARARRRPE